MRRRRLRKLWICERWNFRIVCNLGMGSKAFGDRKLKEEELVAEHPCSWIGSSCIFQTQVSSFLPYVQFLSFHLVPLVFWLLVLFFWEFAWFPCPSPRWVSAERNLESTTHLRFFSPFLDSQGVFLEVRFCHWHIICRARNWNFSAQEEWGTADTVPFLLVQRFKLKTQQEDCAIWQKILEQ